MKKSNKIAIAVGSLSVAFVILVVSLSIHTSIMKKRYPEMVSAIQEDYKVEISDISQKYDEIYKDAEVCILYQKLIEANKFTEMYDKNLITVWFDIEDDMDKASKTKYEALQEYNRDLTFENWISVGELSTQYKDIIDYLKNVDTSDSDYYVMCVNDYFRYIYDYRNVIIDIAVEGKKAGDDERNNRCDSVADSVHYATQLELLNKFRSEYYSEGEFISYRYMTVLIHVEEMVKKYEKDLEIEELAEQNSAKNEMNAKIQSIEKYSK